MGKGGRALLQATSRAQQALHGVRRGWGTEAERCQSAQHGRRDHLSGVTGGDGCKESQGAASSVLATK